jgi:hypothetical protein
MQRDSLAQSAGDDILALRITGSSRFQYESALNRYKVWLKINYSALVQANRIVLPLPALVCQEYLAYMAVKRDRNGIPAEPPQYNSYSTINGCRNAMKYLYYESKRTMLPELDAMLAGIPSIICILMNAFVCCCCI